MNINYSWTFPMLFVKKVDETLTDVVMSVMWNCEGIDSDTQTSANTSGTVALGDADVKNFIEYPKLVYNDINGWVSVILDIPSIQDEISNIIDSKINSGMEAMLPPFDEQVK